MIAVFALGRRPIIFAYLGFAFSGAVAAGLAVVLVYKGMVRMRISWLTLFGSMQKFTRIHPKSTLLWFILPLFLISRF